MPQNEMRPEIAFRAHLWRCFLSNRDRPDCQSKNRISKRYLRIYDLFGLFETSPRIKYGVTIRLVLGGCA